MPRLRLIAAVAAALLLTACAGEGIRAGRGDREHWQLSGKIGLRAPHLAESAYINWRQCDSDYTVRISGPLGRTVARIDGHGRRVTLRFEDRPPMTTDDPSALMQQQLGWSLPIRALRYWVRAEAAPGSTATFSGSRKQPTTLRQQGWQVDYLAYHHNAALALPAKLRVSGRGDLQATLLIREWQLGDAAACPSTPAS